MRITIQQIAEQAGVSRGTVDRALNNRGRIDPAVAANIKKSPGKWAMFPIEKKILHL